MSAYANLDAIKESKRIVPMTSRMKKVKALLEAIEEMKREMALVKYNERMPFVIKTQKLAEMQAILMQTEHHTLGLLQAELDEHGSVEDCDGHCNDGDGHDGEDSDE